MNEDKAREAFEAHMKADWRGRESAAWRNPDGSYIYTETEWRAFQAALQWAASQQADAKAWAVLNEHGDVSMVFLDRAEALTYCGEGEQPVPLVSGGAASQQAAEGWSERVQKRATDLHHKAAMPWPDAEALVLNEVGIDDRAIDELIGECGYAGLQSMLITTDELRQFTRSVLVHQPAPPSTQGGADEQR